RRAADAEVADHEDVAVLMHAVEAGRASDLVGSQGDLVLEEPEALLRVSAVVEAVGAEEEHLTRRGPSARARARVRRQRVAGCECVPEVVLVRQPTRTVLPRPLVDVD